MTPTKAQLKSIEWNGHDSDGAACCPACGREPYEGHNDVCFIAACLATPDAPPTVEVGDVVEWRTDVCRFVHINDANRLADAVKYAWDIAAIYRPVWVKETK